MFKKITERSNEILSHYGLKLFGHWMLYGLMCTAAAVAVSLFFIGVCGILQAAGVINLNAYSEAGIAGYTAVLYLLMLAAMLPISAVGYGVNYEFISAARKREVVLSDMFVCFRKKIALKTIGAALYMALRVLLWGLIPVVGFVLFIIKSYEYSFTVMNVIDHPEMRIRDALADSCARTKGYKSTLFAYDMIVCVILSGISFAIMLPAAYGGKTGLVLTVYLFLMITSIIASFIIMSVRAAAYADATMPEEPMDEPVFYSGE